MNAVMNCCHLGLREFLSVILTNECRPEEVRGVLSVLVLAVLSTREPQVTQGEEEEELPTRPRRQTAAVQLECSSLCYKGLA